MITKDTPLWPSYLSALHQDYADYSLMLHGEKAHFTHNDPQISKYFNCSHNRNSARKMALSSDADYFLFVDDDTVLPPNAISSLLAEDKDIIGGWYKMIHGDKWISGKAVDGNFIHFTAPEKGVVEVDMTGMGCTMVSRRALLDLEFEAGMNLEVSDTDLRPMMAGESLVFALAAQKKGYKLYMHGDVICTHLPR